MLIGWKVQIFVYLVQSFLQKIKS